MLEHQPKAAPQSTPAPVVAPPTAALGESPVDGSNQSRLEELGDCGRTVEPGDTLWGLAETYFGEGMAWGDLYDTNRDTVGDDPDRIFPGQVLDICRESILTGEAQGPEVEAVVAAQPPADFATTAADLFPTLDTEGDGFVSEADLDAAMNNPDLDVDQAAALITLRQLRSELEELSNDEYFDEDDGITLEDLRAYRESGELPESLQNAQANFAYRQTMLSGASTELFANGAPDLAAMRQGSIGDCYFLAAMGSVVAQDPQALVDMIVPEEDGTYTVTFPNGQTTNVAAPTLAEIGTYGSSGADGMWVTLMERAAGQIADPDATVAPEALDGGSMLSRAGAALFSSDGTTNADMNSFTSQEEVANRMEAAFAEGRSVVGHINGSPFGSQEEGLPNGHAYSVTGFDRASGTVTLRNPWGRQEHEDSDGNPVDGSDDGTFTLTLEEYNRLFTATVYSNGAFTPPAAE